MRWFSLVQPGDLAHQDGRTRLWGTSPGKNASYHSFRSMRREETIF